MKRHDCIVAGCEHLAPADFCNKENLPLDKVSACDNFDLISPDKPIKEKETIEFCGHILKRLTFEEAVDLAKEKLASLGNSDETGIKIEALAAGVWELQTFVESMGDLNYVVHAYTLNPEVED